jgi:hypothetical protein
MSSKRKDKGKGKSESAPASTAASGEKRAWRTRHENLQSQNTDFRGTAIAKYVRSSSGLCSSATELIPGTNEASMTQSQTEVSVSKSEAPPVPDTAPPPKDSGSPRAVKDLPPVPAKKKGPTSTIQARMVFSAFLFIYLIIDDV